MKERERGGFVEGKFQARAVFCPNLFVRRDNVGGGPRGLKSQGINTCVCD